jgi:hypothetical protein
MSLRTGSISANLLLKVIFAPRPCLFKRLNDFSKTTAGFPEPPGYSIANFINLDIAETFFNGESRDKKSS